MMRKQPHLASKAAFRLANLGLVVALVIGLTAGLPGKAHAESIPNYELKLGLDYETGVVTAFETVTYTNRTGAPLKTVAFAVIPAHFDAFSLKRATVDGGAVEPTLTDITLEVPLGHTLAPGESTVIALDFIVTVPPQGSGRFGRAEGITALGNWFPIAHVWRNGDWLRHKYTSVGDAFFSEASDFDVTLTLANAPATTIVAHSGELVAREGPRWLLRGRNIRDFAMCISHRYEATSEQVGSTSVSVFYLPEHSDGGRQMLQTAVDLLRWGNTHLGAYPYPSMHVAESPGMEGVGQEYPNLALIGTGVVAGPVGKGSYTSYLVAHEMLHQWFYGMVGNDQVREPWLDEGMTVHVSYQYIKASAPSVYESMWANLVKSRAAAVAQWGDPPLDTTIYDYVDDNQYFALLYRKGAVFCEELRTLMGDEAYFALLREYVAQNRYGIATTKGFLTLVRDRVGTPADPLIARHFSADVMSDVKPTATLTATATATAAATAAATATPPPTAVPTVTPTLPPTATPGQPSSRGASATTPVQATTTPAPTTVPTATTQPAPPASERITRIEDAEIPLFLPEMPTPIAVATVIVASTIERQYPVDAPVAGGIGLVVGLVAGYVLGGARRGRRRRW